jgi:broad specificity phosphatase PhoE
VPSGSQTVCITRHGERLDFADPEWFNSAARPYDPPLSPAGITQSRELGRRLATEGIAHIFCSPFLRSIQTAHEIAEILDLSIHVESGLSEWLNADWFRAPELPTATTLQSQYPRISRTYTSRVDAIYPETGERALARAAESATQLVTEFSGNLLLVGHGASVLGATAGLLRQSAAATEPRLQPIRYCCLVKLVHVDADEWRMELNGDVSHLSRTETAVRFA